MSPTEKAETSRRNGQLSEGPTSPEGKRIASRNALKHGFASETMAIPNDEHSAYAKKLQTWVDQLRPQGPVEETLVERICRNSWKLTKIAEREDELIDIRSAMADELDDEAADELERELRLLARYEQAAERHFHKALNALMKLRSNLSVLLASTPAPPPFRVPAPAPSPAPRPQPLVIPPAPNKPSFLDDFNPLLNVAVGRSPIANGKTHRAGVK